MLVNGERVKGIFVVLAKPGVEKGISRSLQLPDKREGDAERTHGVEDAKEFDRNCQRVFQHPGFLEAEVGLAVGLRRHQLPNGSLVRAPVAHEHLIDAKRRAALQQAALGNEPGQASRRIGAAAEAENEDLVARLVVVDQPFIGAGDRGIDTLAEHAAADPFTEFGAEAGGVIGALLAAIGACRQDQRAKPPDVGVVADLVPGAVQKQCETFLRGGCRIRHVGLATVCGNCNECVLSGGGDGFDKPCGGCASRECLCDAARRAAWHDRRRTWSLVARFGSNTTIGRLSAACLGFDFEMPSMPTFGLDASRPASGGGCKITTSDELTMFLLCSIRCFA